MEAYLSYFYLELLFLPSFCYKKVSIKRNQSFNISQRFAHRNQLHHAIKITGTSIGSGSSGAKWTLNNHILPQLQLGLFKLSQVPITIRSEDPAGIYYLDILGNTLLKHFNAIIEFKNKVIYLKPNNISY